MTTLELRIVLPPMLWSFSAGREKDQVESPANAAHVDVSGVRFPVPTASCSPITPVSRSAALASRTFGVLP
jgi:hypothetical protein